MYFPDQALIPFIKAADNKIKKFANSDGIREHGRNIAGTATEQARMDKSLKKLFKEFMQTKFDSLDELYFFFSNGTGVALTAASL